MMGNEKVDAHCPVCWKVFGIEAKFAEFFPGSIVSRSVCAVCHADRTSKLSDSEFQSKMVGCKSAEEITTCELHVGFISIMETDAEIANLRRNQKEPVAIGGIAISGIEKTNHRIKPINKTAAIVAKVE